MKSNVRRALLALSITLVASCGGLPAAPRSVTLEGKKPGAELAIEPAHPPVKGAPTDESDSVVPVLATDPQDGERDALVTIVEFSDFQCPFCSRAQLTMDRLRETYKPGELRVVWKHDPLPFHKLARPLAEAGVAVMELGGSSAFFRYAQLAFAGQRGMDEESAVAFARQAGVDARVVEEGLRDKRWAARVEQDVALAKRLGVTGTPAFFINGRRISGAQPFERFTAAVDLEILHARVLLAQGTPPSALHAAAAKENYQAPKTDDEDEAPDPGAFKVPVDSSPSRGPQGALITMVVFSDFQCPFCKRVEPTLEQLRRTYGDRLRIVWKDMPLPFHDRAMPAAILAREARAQKGDAAFWDMHDRLFASQGSLQDTDLERLAREAGLDVGRARRALARKSHQGAIYTDMDLGDDLRASGAPHFFVNGRRLVGAQPFEKFKTLIDDELTRASAAIARGISPGKIYDELQKDAKGPPPPEQKPLPPSPGAPFRGAAGARVTIVEFSDFQCSYCKRVEPTLDEILKNYPGRVKLEWRNLPLPMHADAELAAEAALEAQRQRGNAGFFGMHKLLFEAQATGLARPALEDCARKMGLDMARFRAALDGRVHRPRVAADVAAAQQAGIDGTPGFVINGTFLSGAQPYRVFRRAVDRALSIK